MRRWPWIVGGLMVALLLFFALFDWNVLRGPVERYANESMGRAVRIGHLDVEWDGLTPRIVLSDVSVGNPEWAEDPTMGQAEKLSFQVRLYTLLTDEIVLPNLRLQNGEVGFIRNAEGQANWRFKQREEEPGKNVNVLTLSIDRARVRYSDAVTDVHARLQGHTIDEGQYRTKIGFVGEWQGTRFEGSAKTGSALSLRGSEEPFPMAISGSLGRTRIDAEGEVADVTRFRHIDADFAISGPSLATLYAPLRLALPETPPYKARGRLTRAGDVYRYLGFTGTIGSSDVAGDARYELREPRSLLTAQLKSEAIDVADLGPLIGAGGRSRERGQAAPAGDDGLFPDTEFNAEKLAAMDADVRLTAGRLRVTPSLLLNAFTAHARLIDRVLTLGPLNFDFAGGRIRSTVVLDGTREPLAGSVSLDASQLHLSRLVPETEQLKTSSGRLGGQLRLRGRGNSVDAQMATADGSVSAAMTGGRISEVAVWLVNLHGGELLPALFGRDKTTPIRCAATALDVDDGIARVRFFVFDTEASRIGADGTINLAKERFDLTLHPRPKDPGILSLRGPVHIAGPFRNPDFEIGATSVARGVGALALAFVNPLLSLIPLIETGPGEDAACRAVLDEVRGAAEKSGAAPEQARPEGRGEGKKTAPIVNVPPGKGRAESKVEKADTGRPGRDRTLGQEERGRDRAPIVDVDPRKIDAGRARQDPAPVVNVPPGT